jgi:hypothetical protein
MFVWSSEFAEPQQIIKRDEAMLLDTLISEGVLIFVSRAKAGRIHRDIYCRHFAPHAGVNSNQQVKLAARSTAPVQLTDLSVPGPPCPST